MIRKIRMICVLLLQFGFINHTHAGNKATEDKELVNLLSQLKTADGYSYDITVVSRMDGMEKPETSKMTNYQSRTKMIVYSKSDDIILFVCAAGQFRVNVKQKEVFYHQCKDSSEVAELSQLWNDPSLSGLVDTFFLQRAHIVEKKNEKNMVRYKLRYPEDSGLKETNILYNKQTSFFSSISYSFERIKQYTAAQSAMIRQNVTMNNYKKTVPAEVEHLLEVSKDMKSYLQQTYKGYNIQPI